MEILRLGPEEETDGLPPEEFARVLEGLVGPDSQSFAASLPKETLIRFFDTPITTAKEVAAVIGLLGEMEVWEIDQRFGTVENGYRVSLTNESE